MPRRPLERAREEFPDWPERPCLEEWTVREHPCPWYRFGHDCERAWSELTHPGDYVVMTLLYVALVLAFVVLCYYIYASRKKRCELHPRAHDRKTSKKKIRHNRSLVRTMSQDALMLNADGSERFVWSSYNDYERAILWSLGVCITQCIAYIDPNGYYKRLSLSVRAASQGSIRIFVDLTLFQMAAGYRKALRPAGTPRDWGVIIGCILSTAIQAVTLSLENTQLPKAGNPSCFNTRWNFGRHFVASFLEFTMIYFTLRYALRVRTKLKKSKSRDTRQGRRRLKAAVDQIITRTFLLCAITFLVMGFNAFVGARSTGNYFCDQPACSFPDYFSSIFWAVLYVVTTWFGVIFFGVGLPPPIACYGSKPTVSAICCCCPRPAWLTPDSQRLSESSSIEESNESEYSSEYTLEDTYQPSSNSTSHSVSVRLWSFFFGTKTSKQEVHDASEHASLDDDDNFLASQAKNQHHEDYDEEAFFRDSQESKENNDPINTSTQFHSNQSAHHYPKDEASLEVHYEAAVDSSKHHDTILPRSS